MFFFEKTQNNDMFISPKRKKTILETALWPSFVWVRELTLVLVFQSRYFEKELRTLNGSFLFGVVTFKWSLFKQIMYIKTYS